MSRRELDEAMYGTDFPTDSDLQQPNGIRPLTRTDLADLAERPRERPALHMDTLYPAKLQVIGGEPGHGKSTVIAWWALRAIERGHPVAMFDWEAGPDHTADLLASMGADTTAIRKYLHYYPFAQLDLRTDVPALAAELRAIRPVITSFDSSIALLSQMGGNENSPGDIRRMWAAIAPIAHRLGAAVIASDHSGKDASESRYNRGSTDKLAAVDTSWKLAAIQQFTRHQDGKLHLTCVKDRLGWLWRNWQITVTRSPLALHWEKTRERQAPGGASAALLAALDDQPVTIKTLVDRIVDGGGYPVKESTARKALADLADDGLADRVTQGGGLPTLWCSVPHPG